MGNKDDFIRIGQFYVRKSTEAKVRLLLMNPLTQRIEWGAMSKLVDRLLDEWADGEIARIRQKEAKKAQEKEPTEG